MFQLKGILDITYEQAIELAVRMQTRTLNEDLSESFIFDIMDSNIIIKEAISRVYSKSEKQIEEDMLQVRIKEKKHGT